MSNSDRVFTQEQKAKLTHLIQEGMTVMQEVDDLSEGLNDTVKAVAEQHTKLTSPSIAKI
jgi:hypothetical protein